jgi:archaellum component FlaF (FlaF/FlaG flagellin family)
MALEKLITVDQIEVVANGSVQVRTKTAVLEDGDEITRSFHRHVVAPGDDYSAEDARVQAICAATHTADVVAAYAAEQAKATPVALPEAEA